MELDSVKMLTDLTLGPNWSERTQASYNIGIHRTFSPSSPISNNNKNRTQGSDPLGTYLIQFPWNVLQKGIDVCSLIAVHGTHIGQLIFGEFGNKIFYNNIETKVIFIFPSRVSFL